MWVRQHRSLVMAGGIGVLAGMLFIMAIIPIYTNATDVLHKIEIKTKELDALNSKVAILSKLDPAVLEDRVTVLDMAIPPRKDVLLYLTSVEGLSRELDLTFGGLSLAPGDITLASPSAGKALAKQAGVQRLETQIKMNGRQESLYAFLRTIEEVLPLMQINDVKVSILGPDQYSLTLTLGMLWAEPATLDIKGPVTLFNSEEDAYFSQLSNYRQFGVVGDLPQGGTGKNNLFAPHSPSLVNVQTTTTTEE